MMNMPVTTDSGALQDALLAADEGNRAIETAFRELWGARERERRHRDLAIAEAMRDLGHELKNPLAGVRGLTMLLERELEEAVGESRSLRLVNKIRDGLQHLEAIVASRLAAPVGTCDARAVALEVADLARAQSHSEGRDIDFSVNVPEGIELSLPPTHLFEVLANLVRNAVEAVDDGGHIALRVASRTDEVVVFVEDNGCGLPDETPAHLFQRGVSTKGENRGRGLAICRELISACHGTVTFERLPRGTRALVHIPRGNR